MRINMSESEKITQKEVKAAVKALNAGEASKGATIRTLFAGGMSVKEISTTTGILYNHCYNVCQTEVYKNHLEADIVREREGGTKTSQILEKLQEGKSIAEVSKELGCLYNQVWQVAKKNGLTLKQQAGALEVAAQ